MEKIYGEDGLLSEVFEDYNPRNGQINMAKDTFDLFTSDYKVGVMEGAVGVGKTLAYLIPPVQKGHQVVVATSSNTLLDQLVQKDLPIVDEMFDITFSGLKGLNNYLCKRLYNEKEVFNMDIYEDGTKGDQVEWEEWSEVTTNSNECLRQKCSFYDECYYQRQKEKAMRSDVLVINHHLLAAYVEVKNKADHSILPDFDTLIVDEAHELESNVISFHTQVLSEYVFDKVLTKFMKASNKVNDKEYKDPSKIGKKSLSVNKKLQEFPFDTLIADLNEIIKNNEGKLIKEPFEELGLHVSRLEEIERKINSMNFLDEFGDFTMPPTIKSYLRYFRGIVERLQWLRDNPAEIAIWEENGKIKLTNINVDDFLEGLWDGKHTSILTSATIMVDGKADFLKDRLGIKRAFEGQYDSCYDYEQQATLLIPKKNNPKRKDEFKEKIENDIDKIIKNGHDKTLILFTSYRDMDEFVPKLKIKYDNVLSQSRNLSKKFLLERFAELDKSILVAQAASFGTGVDIKGDKNIILVKLNFDVPTDPLFVAQSEVIKNNGGNPFMDLSIPNVAIRTKQQIGRGIRSKKDHAFIAILDGRTITTGWGRKIFNSLPKMKYYDKI